MVEKLIYTHSCSLLSLCQIKWKSWRNAVVLYIVGPGYHCHYRQETGYSIMIGEDFLKKVLEIHTLGKGQPTEVGFCQFLMWCEGPSELSHPSSTRTLQEIKFECTGYWTGECIPVTLCSFKNEEEKEAKEFSWVRYSHWCLLAEAVDTRRQEAGPSNTQARGNSPHSDSWDEYFCE